MLQPLELTWVIRHDALFVTSKDAADSMLTTKVLGTPSASLAAAEQTAAAIRLETGRDHWDEMGGPGSISVVPRGLVVSQTRDVLEAIERWLALRSVGSGGEALGAETYEWGKSALGVSINEFYGQTECNLVLASCAMLGMSRPGAIGKPVPGHDVAVIRADGTQAVPGELGQIAVRRPDPVMFLEYWQRPDATGDKFIGDWMATGDQGIVDEDGYFQFVGRDDDVITSAGYRIGPGEIEDCLIRHPAVALAAAGYGLVMHNADLSALAAGLLILSLGRPASAAE